MIGAIVTSGGTVASLESDGAKCCPTDVRAAILQYTDSCTRLGLGPGSRVAIHRMLTDRTAIVLIALNELGYRVVPLSPTTRLEMVDEITAMINAAAIVAETSPALPVRRLHERDVSTIRYSRLDEAYIPFTSGSSSTPNGVLGPRSGHQHRRDWGREAYVSPNIQRCAIVTDPAFIDSPTTIMGVYRAGKHLIIPLLLVQRDLGRLAGFIESEQIEHLESGPDIREVSTGSDAAVQLVHPAIGTCLGYFPLLECIACSIAARRHGCLVRVLPGLNPIIGSTDEEACQRKTGLDSRIDPHRGILQLEKSPALPPDSPESDDAFTTDPIRPELRAGNQSYLQVIKDMAAAGRYTVHSVAQMMSSSRGHRVAVGSPKIVADAMIDWVSCSAADGYTLMPAVLLADLEPFVDEVIPLLRAAGYLRDAIPCPLTSGFRNTSTRASR